MPLLRNGQWAEKNPWVRLEDDAPLPEINAGKTALICSLSRYLKLEQSATHGVSGIWLQPEDDVTLLAGHLEHVQLIVIDFPAFTDGRGYSQARLLRTQLEYAGELRASGDVRPDQILFMARAGIDTFDFPEQTDEKVVMGALSAFSRTYQPSYSLPIAG